MLQLDHTSDQALTDLWRFAQLYSLPDYVKQASPEVLQRKADLDSLAFADNRHRQFPCHTKAATYLSHLYFLHNMSKMASYDRDMTARRLDEYAARWQIEADVAALREKHASLQQPPEPRDEDFMLVRKVAGKIERHYPIRNLAEVKAAGEWLHKHSDHFTFDERRAMANSLREKMAELSVSLADPVEAHLDQLQGRGFNSPDAVLEQIDRRIKLASKKSEQAPFNAAMTKLAAQLRENPKLLTCAETSDNLCRTLDVYDRVSGLQQFYGDAIGSPEDVIYGHRTKDAAEALKDLVTLTTGSVFHKDAFAKLSISALRDVFGGDLAGEVSDGIGINPEKMAELAATFPRADADLLERVLADCGEKPAYKQASAFQPLKTETLLGLAAAHTGA